MLNKPLLIRISIGCCLVLVLVLLQGMDANAQNVAINATGNAPNASALLDMDGTNKGLLIPRVTYCHRVTPACSDGMLDGSGNLVAAAQGLLVYQTDGSGDGEGFYYNTSSTTTPTWVKLFGGTPSSGWELSGNAGTTTGTNFLGTTDAVDLAIYTNNTERIRVNGVADANEGFVGIGTSTPGQTLDVAGDVEIGGGAADYDGSDEFLHINSRNQDWYIGVKNLATANLNDFHIGLTQAEDGIFHIEPGGNVGIGLTSPTAPLHVQQATETGAVTKDVIKSYQMHGTGSGTSTIKGVYSKAESNSWSGTMNLYGLYGEGLYTFSGGGSPTGVNLYGVYGVATGHTVGTQTAIGGYFTATGADNNYAGIFDMGFVGVGITSPTYRLHVYDGTVGAVPAIYGENTQPGGEGVRGVANVIAGRGVHGMTSAATGWAVYGEATGSGTTGVYGESAAGSGWGVYGVNGSSGIGVEGVSSTGIAGKFRLSLAGTSIISAFDGGTEVFTVDDGGNVGVGTTGPLSKLSVNGAGDVKYNIYSSGSSTVNGAAAIMAEQIAPTGINTSTAIFGKITTFSSGYQYGVRGDVTNGSSSTNGRAHGVQGTAGNEDINFGIYGSVTGSQEAAAVFGWDRTGAEPDPIPSMASAGNSWAGFFQGNTYVNSNLGIGDLTPASALTVGSGDLFQVNSSGNIVKINNVTYSWPATQGTTGQVLENDGSGNLTWVTPSGGGSSGTLIFYEDFEGAGTETYTANTDPLTGLPEWSYETAATGRLRLAAGAGYYKGGNNAATLDVNPSGSFVVNYLIAEVDLKLYRGSTSLTLDFSYMHHGEENHTNDRVWVRGSNADAWLEIYDTFANRAAPGVWADVTSLDIDAMLTAGSQMPSTTFQIRFGQEDNFPSTSTTGLDGFTFDNITIRGN